MTPARQFAFAVLMEVDEHGGYANDLLHSALGRGLTLADRRLATEIVMGVLRWRGEIDAVVARAANRSPARIELPALQALRIGIYQLRYLTRVPPNAAVNESVELAKHAEPRLASFVNAVLRRVARETPAPPEPRPSAPARQAAANEAEVDDAAPDAAAEIAFETDPAAAASPAPARSGESHPAWLLERWRRNFGPEATTHIAAYDNAVPPVALWLADPGALAQLAELELAPGRLLTASRRVLAGDITKTAPFQTGQVWVQDEASQLVAHLLEPRARDRILDACAAPGGKAALLHALAPAAAVIAVEPRPQRARLLRRRLPPAAHVVAADATRTLPFRWQFDRILVDAPCTGTGTLARNPEIRWRLQPDDPLRVSALQLSILTNAAAALRPGGRLVYSVCSLEPEEGPAVINRLLANDSGLTLVPAARVLANLNAAGQLLPGLPPLTQGAFFQILPGACATDGFFAAILERTR